MMANASGDGNSEARPPAPLWQLRCYMLTLCVTTASRSFEAGVLGSMMYVIKPDLGFSYSAQGMLASAPDYGLIPGALAAIAMFNYFPAHTLTSSALVGIGLIMLWASLRPSLLSLTAARIFGGLCWSSLAVHYPMWINAHALPASKTMWLGLFNTSLLIGTFAGYLAGAIASAHELSWTWVYGADAVVMLLLASVSYLFPVDMVQVVRWKPEAEDTPSSQGLLLGQAAQDSGPAVNAEEGKGSTQTDAEVDGILTKLMKQTLPLDLQKLLCNRLYQYLLGYSALVAGESAFLLYFVLQLIQSIGASTREAYMYIFIVMISAVPATLIGAAILTRLGGYSNYPAAFGMFLTASIIGTVCTAIITVAGYVQTVWLMFIGFLGLVFAAALTTSAISGVSVSLLKDASHYAAGIQFFVQSTSKLVVPQLGGIAIDLVSLRAGFFGTFFVMAFLACSCSGFGLREAYSPTYRDVEKSRVD